MTGLKDRDETIAKRMYDGEKPVDLSTEYSLSVSMLHKIYHNSQYDALPRKRGSKGLLIDRKPLSNLHSQIGNDISYYRTFVRKKELSDFAMELGMSRMRLSALEKGVYDPTLSELERISRALQIDLGSLIRPRRVGEKSPILSIKDAA